MDEVEFFAPWRLVAAFGDGTRMLFDGLTEEQARGMTVYDLAQKSRSLGLYGWRH